MLGGVGEGVAVEATADSRLGRAAGTSAARIDFPGQRAAVTEVPTAAPRASVSFADWSRAWGLYVEIAASVLAGVVATLIAGNETPTVLGVLGVWVVANFHHGRRLMTPLPQQIRGIGGSLLVPLAMTAVAVGFMALSPTVVRPATVAVVSATVVSALCRIARWKVQSPVRVLFVGDHAGIAQAAARWDGSGRARAVAGVLIDDQDPPSHVVGIPVASGVGAAPAMVAQHNVDVVIVQPGAAVTSSEFRRLGWALERSHSSLAVFGVLDSVAPHRITPGVVNLATVIGVHRPRATTATRVTKFVIDRVVGTVLLVLVSPLLVALVIAVRLDSKGPGLFAQTRVGRHGKHFKVIKLRTMVHGAEDLMNDLEHDNEYNSVLFKIREDPRVTRVGRFLRRSSLDELPQLINVVKGEMSLVGPRPNLPVEVARMDSDSLRRLAVRPGITGLWQVSGRSDLCWEEAVALDTYYVDNLSLLGDLTIALRTVKAVLKAEGAY